MSWARRRSARPRAAGRAGIVAALALAGAGVGCYSFSGGGGLPPHIRSAYVAPVENQTPQFGISELLTQQLLDAARDRLGLRLASEVDADLVIRASVQRYSNDAVAFEAEEGVGADVFERRVNVVARVEILDMRRQEILYSAPSLSGIGEYAPEAETEDAGIQVALENLVQKIVDGAQARW